MSLDALLQRGRPSFWSCLLKDPVYTLARKLHDTYQAILSKHGLAGQESAPLCIICTSDTHNSQPEIPFGDLFVHAGDLSQGGTREEIQKALDWINKLPHQHKVVIAGNHDMCLDSGLSQHQVQKPSLNWGSVVYLQNSSTTLHFLNGRALNLYGTPRTREHGSWGFQFPKGADVFTGTIPEDVEILITHSPPRFHLDVDGWGDENLLRELWRVKPRLHVFGHVHEGYGKHILTYDKFQNCYEHICRQRIRGFGNTRSLLKMGLQLLYLCISQRSQAEHNTEAVNASAVGGLRDNIKRKPIVVYV